MRNGSIFLKSIFGLSAFALVSLAFFSSCQKAATSTVNVGDWGKITELPNSPRTQAVSFTIDGVVYIGGGYNGNTRLNDFYRFDEPTQSFYSIASFPGVARNGAAGFSISHKGYVVGGYDGTSYYNDVWSYDPQGNSWALVSANGDPNTPFEGRLGAVGFNVGNTGYFATGIDSLGYWQNDLWMFDGATWTQGQSLKNKRTGAAVFVYNNLAYVVGGVNNGTYQVDVSVYHPTTNSWSYNRPIINLGDSSYDALYGFNINRSNTAAFLINDTAYLSTGNYNGILNTTWCYDIGADLWFQKTSFEGTAREGAIGFNVNNHGYLVSGDNGSNYYDDLWEFYPDATQTTDNNY